MYNTVEQHQAYHVANYNTIRVPGTNFIVKITVFQKKKVVIYFKLVAYNKKCINKSVRVILPRKLNIS